MTNNFSYVKAVSLAQAIKELGSKGACLHAGGIDLLGCARSEIFPVEKVVSISGLKSLAGISARPDGGLKIGSLARLSELASSASVAAKYPVLAEAAASVGSPPIREQGTVGGNLCQRPRCWYFRGDFECLKKGGKTCYALTGENQYHAIFGGGPCFCVHPSDVAVALCALQATFGISGPLGTRAVRCEEFFVGPNKSIDKENVLLPGEIVTDIRVPPVDGTMQSAYRKIRARGSWDFALAAVAAVFETDAGRIRSARIVLGGVGPYPWRADAAEKLVAGKKVDGALAAAASEAAVAGAVPLRDNAYKLDMVRGAVEELLAALLS